ncbi:hypothetical protein E5K00_12785 [Hymenobacter aquaticus]|uniref:Uncharacterized protein n=1 Tax=Hymenobacter aquaticus TaxID=1867101 RepID=A0A4Z0Q8I0_9BACT|nr:hypothetical protein [Hymenobacter aquaticus]TGE26025.1 hypothetical protein E5K00_12785 [Hymenobacter aquaticus]
MKTSLLSLAAAFALLASSAAVAAPSAGSDWRDDARREMERRRDDRNDKDFNYGYDRSHRVTAAERARWEAAHKNDRYNDRYDRNDNRLTSAEQAREQARLNRLETLRRQEEARRDDRNDKDFNYGYDRNHRVSAAERARWEAAHKNDRYNGRR